MKMYYEKGEDLVYLMYDKSAGRSSRRVTYRYHAKPTLLLLNPTNEKEILRVHFEHSADFPDWIRHALNNFSSQLGFVENSESWGIYRKTIRWGQATRSISIRPTIQGHINQWFSEATSEVALKYKEALLDKADFVEDVLLNYKNYFADLGLYYGTSLYDPRYSALEYSSFPMQLLNYEEPDLEHWEVLFQALTLGPPKEYIESLLEIEEPNSADEVEEDKTVIEDTTIHSVDFSVEVDEPEEVKSIDLVIEPEDTEDIHSIDFSIETEDTEEVYSIDISVETEDTEEVYSIDISVETDDTEESQSLALPIEVATVIPSLDLPGDDLLSTNEANFTSNLLDDFLLNVPTENNGTMKKRSKKEETFAGQLYLF